MPPTRLARKLLGALAIATNHMVSSDHLAQVLWGEEPPPSATNALQTYVYRLRRLLGRDRILTEDHSYSLQLDPLQLDALVFEKTASEAARARQQPEKCIELCRSALALWRGVPFGEFVDEDPFRIEAIRLDELRLFVMELELESELKLGRGELVVGTLEALVEDHPYRERFWSLLVTALMECGRRVEALRSLTRLRGILAETGLEPSDELLQLEEEILTNCPELRSVPRPEHRAGP